VWNPHLIKDIKLIEGVQERITKSIWGISNLPYGERLKVLKLPTLEDRRIRGQLIQLFKFMKGLDKVDLNEYITLDTGRNLRGNNMRIFKSRFRTDVGKFSFVNRIVELWNKLPQNVVESMNVETFKVRLDAYNGGI